MVACTDRNPDRYTIEAPELILEVLSPSTERIDRSEKFAAYTGLASLQVYVLVHQSRRQVEMFRRSTGWQPEVFDEGRLELPEVGAGLDIGELHSRIDLTEA